MVDYMESVFLKSKCLKKYYKFLGIFKTTSGGMARTFLTFAGDVPAFDAVISAVHSPVGSLEPTGNSFPFFNPDVCAFLSSSISTRARMSAS